MRTFARTTWLQPLSYAGEADVVQDLLRHGSLRLRLDR